MWLADDLEVVSADGDPPVGVVTRRDSRPRRLAPRCPYLLVFNRRGELFLHQRTATKDVYPGYWDVAVGGVLAAGEAFAEGARREGREELGVGVEPGGVVAFRYADAATSGQGVGYPLHHHRPPQLQ